MKVLKFGGSSLANAKKFVAVSNIVKQESASTNVSVVLSAPQGVTNQLVVLVDSLQRTLPTDAIITQLKSTVYSILAELKLELASVTIEPASITDEAATNSTDTESNISSEFKQLEQLIEGARLLAHCPEQTAAQILTLGERISIHLLSWIFNHQLLDVLLLNPESFLIAENHAGDPLANIPLSISKFSECYSDLKSVNLMPGFVGTSPDGKTTTLGRNGSDYSAAILAVCLQADVCEIWTDVDGVYNADPRLVKEAKLVDKMSFNEAIELSYFGAKILHPKTITPLSSYDIPCLIKNSLAPEKPGTLISRETSKDTSVKAISSLEDIAMINIAGPGMKAKVGLTSRIFSALGRADIQVILISQSSAAYRISICVFGAQASDAKRCLEHEFELELDNLRIDPIEVITDLAVVSLVGDNMQQQKGIAAKFFSSLSQAGVNISAIAQDSSERSISAVIRNLRTDDAVRICHRKLFLKRSHIDAFVVGCGTVGKELIEQIKQQQPFLLERNIELRVYGIASSKKFLLDADGINLSNHWPDELAQAKQSFSLETINQFVEENHLLNPVIIDATSNESIAMNYANYLSSNYHVVTANKKANTTSIDFYRDIRRAAQAQKRRFLYETNVAAGLPVIDNLQNLLGAGDQLVAFEGILSGSLSYIFGQLHQGLSLSEATKKARELGYTEPNPAEDLSGLDVARKVLIIAREAGLELELNDINLESLITPELTGIENGDEFIQQLPSLDQAIADKVSTAEANNQLLKYVAKIKNGKCEVKIIAVDSSHPLHGVQDGENALAMHTRYYQPTPFVIRGYGAGASVTAAGLFADILRTLVWDLE
ncbi:MAG: bifunctional aspartate kinase/homoserine dehydrogenase I [Kangiellaceae bacterium]|nr:bifunctional aspartate kinase/homoserine dehydrogenase I [Kangiellaceae bacterium]